MLRNKQIKGPQGAKEARVVEEVAPEGEEAPVLGDPAVPTSWVNPRTST